MTAKDDLPPALTPEAEAARKEFEERFHRQREKLRQVSFNVLVWGPNAAGDGPVARKRRQIRDELIRQGHNAMLSEELTSLSDGDLYSEQAHEFFQAEACDAIVVLIEDAPGAMAEVHDFGSNPELARKFVVLAPKRYRDGYSALGALRDLQEAYGVVHWYEEGDLPACEVLSAALRKIEARRFLEYKRKQGARS